MLKRYTLIGLMVMSMTAMSRSNELEGYWSKQQVDEVLAKTIRLRLAPDLSGLNDDERKTVALLLQVGEIMHDLYLDSKHHQALTSKQKLAALHKQHNNAHTQGLLDLYRLFRGPIGTTLDNNREAFLPVEATGAGKNVYPLGRKRADLDAFLQKHPEQRARIMDLRAIVRDATAEHLAADLKTLDTYPVLDTLHPGLRAYFESTPKGEGYYGVPYSVAYAPQIMKAYDLLVQAANTIEGTDADFAQYLRNRSRDFLSDNYESGDAAWVTGSFGKLNAQIGSYETYDDGIYGVKSFFSLSLLLRDEQRSQELRAAIKGIQQLENTLPYEHQKKVREDIPVGVYQIIADFGQARGTNTATILPNESYITRKYGRTILLRHNILTNPELYKITDAVWRAAVVDGHGDDLSLEANFNRTLWHEIGHYLGVDRTKDGRPLTEALAQYSDLMEELKADLVSLYSVEQLVASGHYTEAQKRAIYASGIYRTLQRVKPRVSQPYQTMQLMQMNFFLGNGLLTFKPGEGGRLSINYDKYQEVVEKMLRIVLELQYEGDPKKVEAFINGNFRWNSWLHERLAEGLRDASPYRFRLVTYEALGDK